MSTSMSASDVREIVARVQDPEIPVLSIDDLGILRDVSVEHGSVTVTITPTYSGCPALGTITAEIRTALHEHGIDHVDVRTVLSPAWTTDWMTDDARRRLNEYGIAPPRPAEAAGLLQIGVRCPRCRSVETRERSRFGATACQAQYTCSSCQEPFDHFKRH